MTGLLLAVLVSGTATADTIDAHLAAPLRPLIRAQLITGYRLARLSAADTAAGPHHRYAATPRRQPLSGTPSAGLCAPATWWRCPPCSPRTGSSPPGPPRTPGSTLPAWSGWAPTPGRCSAPTTEPSPPACVASSPTSPRAAANPIRPTCNRPTPASGRSPSSTPPADHGPTPRTGERGTANGVQAHSQP